MTSFSKKQYISISIILVIILASLSVYLIKTQEKPQEITYKVFYELVMDNKVSEVVLDSNAKIKGYLNNGQYFVTDNPRTEDFKEELLLAGVEVKEKDGSLNAINIIQTLIVIGAFIGLIFFLNKGKAKLAQKEINDLANIDNSNDGCTIKFLDVAGNEEAKNSIKELVDFICNPDKYEKLGARIPRGVLLYGPPGTGKTLLAKALAGEAGVPFIAVNGSDFVQVYAGLGASRIRELFKRARLAEKCVIFIDEIDAVGKKRRGNEMSGGNDENDRTLNALLTEMSGFKGNEGIIVVAATNRVDILDDALLRPGRFDRQIEVGLPDVNARRKILQVHTQNKPLAIDVDLDKVALETVYFSGAKLESLMNESAMLAARYGDDEIKMKHINKAFHTVIVGEEKQDRSSISNKDKEITAYHEAGHALVTKLLCPENRVTKVSIIPSTKGVGGFSMNVPAERMYQTKKDIINNIMVALGGRAAEEIVFGIDSITTGAVNDLEKATEMILAMVYKFGMDEKVGLLSYSKFIGRDKYIDNKMIIRSKEVIEDLYIKTKLLLVDNLHILNKITEKLIFNEILEENELNTILSENLNDKRMFVKC
ncbi:ATP-dependent metallopeptidase FtsH/Yme1/Tma family protein [Abyssisolibacter fermentans]|uniref:ATP-dependent metallopeptidase FtsH/Yme1/Tma family protein n=1 Tax=Abyssisolibacter fermentans TaxID=1766203 RepID=UPI000831931A|nr:FtsH/Yme1/Tma family ATP-dependent metallopeptidase [Abyssisolibacter fermentans]